jgi:hypothetical protein
MQVSKGLIIADPWMTYILNGSKIWEMRSSETSMRGPFGLIRKGTGVICGLATLTGVGRRLSPDEMIASFDKHRIPADMIRSGQVAKWNVPWMLADVHPLGLPVPYNHPSGAVTWVNLSADVSRAIAAQFEQVTKNHPFTRANESPRRFELRAEHGVTTAPIDGFDRLIAQPRLTEGNIRHNHFYLRGSIQRFPADLIGGSNKAEKASKEAIIDWGGPSPAMTDIDGGKQFFRGRGWIKQFFESNGARPGDWVLVEETGPYRYTISLKRA